MSGKLPSSLPGDWDDLVVVCGGTSWDGVWFPEKHVADRLSRTAPVLYVDPPLSSRTARRYPELAASLEPPRLRLIRPGLARLTPVAIPGIHRLGLMELNEVLMRRLLRKAVSRLTERVRAVVAASPADCFGVCGERQKVLYATDDFVAGARLTGLGTRQLVRAEARQAKVVDLVVAVSEPLVEKWRALGRETVLLPNGCDTDLFAATDEAPIPADVELPAPVAGFFGHLSSRIDVSLLEAVAERGISLLLVGPRQGTFAIEAMDRLLVMPNVRWVGPKPFEELPSYLRVIDVGLTPYADSEFNRASFPLKTLEYLAAGRAVVATDLPAVAWLNTDLITVASRPGAYADAVEAALAAPQPVELRLRRRRFAALHSWDERTVELARVLGVPS